MRPPVVGRDCDFPHEPPYLAHGALCTGPLCQGWLDRNAVVDSCVNQHAHVAHYWWAVDYELSSGTYHSCSGRQYCDPSFMEPYDG